MTDTTYNGWTNYETWLTALWIDNDPGSYARRLELVNEIYKEHKPDDRRHQLASALKEWIEEGNPLTETASFWADLLGAALAAVDWRDIAENYLNAYSEDQADDTEEE